MSEAKNKIDTGGQAFPMSERDDALAGMTLLDYLAAKAMQGILSNEDRYKKAASAENSSGHATSVPRLCLKAYEIASAMLAEKRRLESTESK